MNHNSFRIIPYHALYPNYTHQYLPYSNLTYPSDLYLPFYHPRIHPSQQERRRQVDLSDRLLAKERRQFKRRGEAQLDKSFKCPYNNCQKSYASNLALNLHMKNKHKGGSKKDRDQIARLVLKLQMEGKPIPKFDIELPPKYIEMNQIRLLLQLDDWSVETAVKKQQ